MAKRALSFRKKVSKSFVEVALEELERKESLYVQQLKESNPEREEMSGKYKGLAFFYNEKLGRGMLIDESKYHIIKWYVLVPKGDIGQVWEEATFSGRPVNGKLELELCPVSEFE
jgi:hypothetical protein